jgi:hypothetical protein
MSAARPNRSLVRLVDWRTVLAAGLPVWASVGGVIAWQKLAPKPVAVAKPIVTHPSSVRLRVEELPPPRVDVPENPFWVSNPVATQSLPMPVEIDPEVAEAFGQAAKELVRGFLTAKPAEPAEQVAANPWKRVVPDGCKTFDTALHFVKNYDEARKQAAKQDKLVCVLHLSGHLDDDGFT